MNKPNSSQAIRNTAYALRGAIGSTCPITNTWDDKAIIQSEFIIERHGFALRITVEQIPSPEKIS